MRGRWTGLAVLCSLLLMFILAGIIRADELSQVVLSPTPDRVVIPSATSPPTDGAPPTEVPPTFTPTNQGPPQLEARANAGNVNVRIEPDPEGNIVGTISNGEFFTVTGRYYRWLQIRFEASPSRSAYVFEELVDIIGDEANIPDLTESARPTADSSALDATSTVAAMQETPGFELTITADARILDAPSGATSGEGQVEGNGSDDAAMSGPLPTFTYPSNLVAQAPTDIPIESVTATPDPSRVNLSVQNGVPPLLPIMVLAGIGIMGLVIGGFRR